ncbi:MAG: signal peptide peptidase SppA [Alphaproteobacteria bacterium]|nr:signal peptide peptidase SppA [Alphaproteobacteria bacterium]
MWLLRWLGRLVWRVVTVLLALVGAAVVSLAIAVGLALYVVPIPGLEPQRLPKSMVLTLTLDGRLGASDGGSLTRALRGRRLGLEGVIAGLTRAETDPQVKGLVLDVGRASPGLAEAQELRQALLRLRAAGKLVFAFADSFGDGGLGGGAAYYLASAADEVWMQPSGDWSWTGLSLEGVFVKGTLEKLGLAADMIQRHEYKGAMEPVTRSSFSEPVRENLGRAVRGWFDQMVKGVAESRKIPEAALRVLVDNAPLPSGEAVRDKLIDRLGYRVDVIDAAGAGDGKAEAVTLERYYRRLGTPWRSGPTIAVIHGEGDVTRSEGRSFGMPRFSAERIGKALEEAAEDADVVAIVLRIDSPGGSYLASDAIFDHIRRARKAKPVVASLKDVAASGGYFVALAADRIVVSPGTLTGSIGVVGGKIVASELMRNAGIATDAIEVGEHAGMWRMTRPFTEEERRRVEAMFDRAYLDFTRKVMEARKLTPSEVDGVARGRVWTGEEAIRLKLADAEGDFVAAIAAAKQLAGLSADTKVRVETYPETKPTWQLLRDAIMSGDLPEEIDTLFEGIRSLAALVRLVPEAGIQLR